MAPTEKTQIIAALMELGGLDEMHALAVIAHRQKTIKAPLTLRAAELLSVEFAKCADPNAGADLMIERVWQGFKAEWTQGPRQPGSVSVNRGVSPVSARKDRLRQRIVENEQGQQGREGSEHSDTARGLPLFAGDRRIH